MDATRLNPISVKSFRSVDGTTQLRALGEESRKIGGFIPLFEMNKVGEYGGKTFYERFERTAFDSADDTFMAVRFEHSNEWILAAKNNKTLAYSFNEKGMEFEATIIDGQRGDYVLKLIREKYIKGVSFAWSYFGSESETEIIPEGEVEIVKKVLSFDDIAPCRDAVYKAAELEMRNFNSHSLPKSSVLDNELRKLKSHSPQKKPFKVLHIKK